MSVLSKHRTLFIIGLKTHAHHNEVPGHDADVRNSIRKTIHESEISALWAQVRSHKHRALMRDGDTAADASRPVII